MFDPSKGTARQCHAASTNQVQQSCLRFDPSEGTASASSDSAAYRCPVLPEVRPVRGYCKPTEEEIEAMAAEVARGSTRLRVLQVKTERHEHF